MASLQKNLKKRDERHPHKHLSTYIYIYIYSVMFCYEVPLMDLHEANFLPMRRAPQDKSIPPHTNPPSISTHPNLLLI